ncbi:M14 family metallopeptidase [Streptomyces sp. NPDC006879]|uniref:M14 family metallopeptidase n=1 Tax=Streptomyces sp. NPDC006879 TaxID=3364767 RepID=UPI00368284DF
MAYAFPTDYAQARQEFRYAARDAGARMRSFLLPGHRGPTGEELRTDTAYLGPATPTRLLVTVSGTHGIEGFCGSACQTRILLGEGVAQAAAAEGTGVLLVHALNPHGFAYQRRVTEENVDLNRNFVDHHRPPHNDPYERVHGQLTPHHLNAFRTQELAVALGRLRDELGPQVLQQAVTHGQYRHPDGLFYGGEGPCWSNRVFRTVVEEQIEGSGATRIGYIDLHTGLGERGYGEPIFRGGPDREARHRARHWYGTALTASEEGTSSSTPIVGNTATAVAEGLRADRELTAITLEFGTQPGPEVLLALCADNWLHLREDPVKAVQSDLKSLIRAAFSPVEDQQWRAQVLQRAREVFSQALAGLNCTHQEER